MCIRMSMSKSPPPPPVHDQQSKPGAMTRKRKQIETFMIKHLVVGKPDIVNLLEAQPCSYTKHKFAEAMAIGSKTSYPYFFTFDGTKVSRSKYPFAALERTLGDALVHGVTELQMNRYLSK